MNFTVTTNCTKYVKLDSTCLFSKLQRFLAKCLQMLFYYLFSRTFPSLEKKETMLCLIC